MVICCSGTVETWLIWKLTKGRVHVTDYSNASRTLMFNINTLDWDQDILKILEIPSSMLPRVESSSCIYGETDASYFGAPIPHRRGGRRSAGCVVWSGMLRSRRSKKYVWDRRIFIDEYRRNPGVPPVMDW